VLPTAPPGHQYALGPLRGAYTVLQCVNLQPSNGLPHYAALQQQQHVQQQYAQYAQQQYYQPPPGGHAPGQFMHAQPRVVQGGHAPQMAMPSHFPQPQLQPGQPVGAPTQPPQPVVHTHGQPVRARVMPRPPGQGPPTSAQVVHPPPHAAPPHAAPPAAAPAAEGGKGAAAQGTNGNNPTAAAPAGDGRPSSYQWFQQVR